MAARIFVVFIFRNLFALISPLNIFGEVNNIYRERGDLAAREVSTALH